MKLSIFRGSYGEISIGLGGDFFGGLLASRFSRDIIRIVSTVIIRYFDTLLLIYN